MELLWEDWLLYSNFLLCCWLLLWFYIPVLTIHSLTLRSIRHICHTKARKFTKFHSMMQYLLSKSLVLILAPMGPIIKNILKLICCKETILNINILNIKRALRFIRKCIVRMTKPCLLLLKCYLKLLMIIHGYV